MAWLTGFRHRPADGLGYASDWRASRSDFANDAAVSALLVVSLFSGYADAPEPEVEESQVTQVFETAASPPIALAADLRGRSSVTATLTTGVALQSAQAGSAAVSGALSTGMSLAADARGKATATAALTTGTALAADVKAQASVSAALTTGGAVVLAADLRGKASVTAAVTTAVQLAAQAAGKASATADLSTGVALQASLRGQAAVTGDLTTGTGTPPPITFTDSPLPEEPEPELYGAGLIVLQPAAGAVLAADLKGRATLTAALTTGEGLMALTVDFPDGDEDGELLEESFISFPLFSTAAGIALAADLRGSASITANLGTGIALGAGLAGKATTTAGLTTGLALVANLPGRATFSGSLGVANTPLAADLVAGARVTASLGTGLSLAANLRSAATLTADLAGSAAQLAANLRGSARLTGGLSTGIPLEAGLQAKATATGQLSASIQLGAALQGRAQFGAAMGASYLTGMPRYIVRRIRARNFEVAATGREFNVARYHARSFEVNAAMSKAERQFDYKDPTEKVRLTFDFTPDLPDGVLLTGVQAVAFEVTLGTDASPSAMANGSAGLDVTAKKAVVPVQGGLDGCDYKISVRCSTSDSQLVLELDGILPVRA